MFSIVLVMSRSWIDSKFACKLGKSPLPRGRNSRSPRAVAPAPRGREAPTRGATRWLRPPLVARGFATRSTRPTLARPKRGLAVPVADRPASWPAASAGMASTPGMARGCSAAGAHLYRPRTR